MSLDEQYMEKTEERQQLMNDQCDLVDEKAVKIDKNRILFRDGEITFAEYMRRTPECSGVKAMRKKHEFKLK